MSTERGRGGRRRRDQRGSTLVEFAFIFPIFMMVVLGMFSGGQSYNRKISMTNAVAEASRYGATLAPGPLVAAPPAACFVVPAVSAGCGVDEWLSMVAAAVAQNGDGDLDATIDGREICVAYVHPLADATRPHAEVSHMAVFTTSDTTPSVETHGPGARCIQNDGRPNAERRVQITVKRTSPLQALFFSYDLDLTARSITRFEAINY